MGWSQFKKDLNLLAEDKRRRAAERETERAARMHAAFGGRLRRMIDAARDENGVATGRPAAVIPRLDGFAADVRWVHASAAELSVRINSEAASSTPAVLGEFGLMMPRPPDPLEFARLRAAAEHLAQRTDFLLHVGPITGEEDREMLADDVAEAAELLLAAIRCG